MVQRNGNRKNACEFCLWIINSRSVAKFSWYISFVRFIYSLKINGKKVKFAAEKNHITFRQSLISQFLFHFLFSAMPKCVCVNKMKLKLHFCVKTTNWTWVTTWNENANSVCLHANEMREKNLFRHNFKFPCHRSYFVKINRVRSQRNSSWTFFIQIQCSKIK